MRVRVFSNVRFFVRVNVLEMHVVTLASVLSFFSSSFFFPLEGEGEKAGRPKEKKLCWKNCLSMYFFFFLPELLLLSLPCYPSSFLTEGLFWWNNWIFDFFFFLSPLEYSIDHDFSFLDPKFGNSAYQIFFPFLNLEQSKEADIKSFPELISRNLIL